MGQLLVQLWPLVQLQLWHLNYSFSFQLNNSPPPQWPSRCTCWPHTPCQIRPSLRQSCRNSTVIYAYPWWTCQQDCKTQVAAARTLLMEQGGLFQRRLLYVARPAHCLFV